MLSDTTAFVRPAQGCRRHSFSRRNYFISCATRSSEPACDNIITSRLHWKKMRFPLLPGMFCSLLLILQLAACSGSVLYGPFQPRPHDDRQGSGEQPPGNWSSEGAWPPWGAPFPWLGVGPHSRDEAPLLRGAGPQRHARSASGQGCRYADKTYNYGELVTQECAVLQCSAHGVLPTALVTASCARCTVAGPHHSTFDGLTYTAAPEPGVAGFLLVRVAGPRDSLQVSVNTSERCEGTCSTCYSHLRLTAPGGEALDLLSAPWRETEVWYRGNERSVPMDGVTLEGLGGVWRQGGAVRVQVPGAVLVEFSPLRVAVWAPPELASTLSGLCGFFDFNILNDRGPSSSREGTHAFLRTLASAMGAMGDFYALHAPPRDGDMPPEGHRQRPVRHSPDLSSASPLERRTAPNRGPRPEAGAAESAPSRSLQEFVSFWRVRADGIGGPADVAERCRQLAPEQRNTYAEECVRGARLLLRRLQQGASDAQFRGLVDVCMSAACGCPSRAARLPLTRELLQQEVQALKHTLSDCSEGTGGRGRYPEGGVVYLGCQSHQVLSGRLTPLGEINPLCCRAEDALVSPGERHTIACREYICEDSILVPLGTTSPLCCRVREVLLPSGGAVRLGCVRHACDRGLLLPHALVSSQCSSCIFSTDGFVRTLQGGVLQVEEGGSYELLSKPPTEGRGRQVLVTAFVSSLQGRGRGDREGPFCLRELHISGKLDVDNRRADNASCPHLFAGGTSTLKVFADEEEEGEGPADVQLWQVDGGVRVAKSLSSHTSSMLVEYREGAVVLWLPSEAVNNFTGLCAEGGGGSARSSQRVTAISAAHNGSRSLLGLASEGLLQACWGVDEADLTTIRGECAALFSPLPLAEGALSALRQRCERLTCHAPQHQLSPNWTQALVRSAEAWVHASAAGDVSCLVGGRRREEGSVFHHECVELACYGGRSLPTGRHDPACCEWEGRWHSCGASFTASCEDHTCTEGVVTQQRALSAQCCTYGSTTLAHLQEVVVGCAVLRCYGGRVAGTARVVESCGLCTAAPGLNMFTWDGRVRAWRASCAYALLVVEDEDLRVSAQFGTCASEHANDLLSCVRHVNVTRTHDHHVQLSAHTASYAAEGRQEGATSELRRHGTAAVWAVDGGVRVLTHSGAMVEVGSGAVAVWVPLTLQGKVVGLCGEFHGRVDPTSPLVRETPATFYSSTFPTGPQNSSGIVHTPAAGGRVPNFIAPTGPLSEAEAGSTRHARHASPAPAAGGGRAGHGCAGGALGAGVAAEAPNHLARPRQARDAPAAAREPRVTFEDIVSRWKVESCEERFDLKGACQETTAAPAEQDHLCRAAVDRSLGSRPCGAALLQQHHFWLDTCRQALCGCTAGRQDECLEQLVSSVQRHVFLRCTALKAPGCRWDGATLAEGVRGYRGCLEYVCRAGRFHRTFRVHPSCCQLTSGDLQPADAVWMWECQEHRCLNGTVVTTGRPDPRCCDYEGGQLWPGQVVSAGCAQLQCNEGTIVPTGFLLTNCSWCQAYSCGHLLTYSGHAYNWRVKCNYTLAQRGASYDPPMAVFLELEWCSPVFQGHPGCLGTLTYRDSPTQVFSIGRRDIGWLDVNGEASRLNASISHYGSVRAWKHGRGSRILGSSGMLVEYGGGHIFVGVPMTPEFEDLQGLCGQTTDERTRPLSATYTPVEADVMADEDQLDAEFFEALADTELDRGALVGPARQPGAGRPSEAQGAPRQRRSTAPVLEEDKPFLYGSRGHFQSRSGPTTHFPAFVNSWRNNECRPRDGQDRQPCEGVSVQRQQLFLNRCRSALAKLVSYESRPMLHIHADNCASDLCACVPDNIRVCFRAILDNFRRREMSLHHAAHPDEHCDTGWMYLDESTYCLSNAAERLPWGLARASCHQRGASLATLHLPAHNPELVDTLTVLGSQYWVGATNNLVSGDQELRWAWTDDAILTHDFLMQHRAGADRDLETCLTVRSNGSVLGLPLPCHELGQFACRKKGIRVKFYDEAASGSHERQVRGNRTEACPTGYFYVRGSCYSVSRHLASWQAAARACRAVQGGDLASFPALPQWEDFREYLTSWRLSGPTRLWVSLQRSSHHPPGSPPWSWGGGQPAKPWAWGPGVPFPPGWGCGALDSVWDFRASPAACSSLNRFLCTATPLSLLEELPPAPPPPAGEVPCPSGWHHFSRSSQCLYVAPAQCDWPTARASCRAYGGHLYSVGRPMEWTLLAGELRALAGAQQAEYWVAASDSLYSWPRQWLWETGHAVNWNAWNEYLNPDVLANSSEAVNTSWKLRVPLPQVFEYEQYHLDANTSRARLEKYVATANNDPWRGAVSTRSVLTADTLSSPFRWSSYTSDTRYHDGLYTPDLPDMEHKLGASCMYVAPHKGNGALAAPCLSDRAFICQLRVPPRPCGEDFFFFEGVCILASISKETWYGAGRSCGARDASLMALTNLTLWADLALYAAQVPSHLLRQFWVGGSNRRDDGTVGELTWLQGGHIDPQLWGLGDGLAPPASDGAARCVYADGAEEFKLRAESCDTKRWFLCAAPPAAPSAPPAGASEAPTSTPPNFPTQPEPFPSTEAQSTSE